MVKKKKIIKTVILVFLSVISLCGCSLSLCFSMGLGINRSSEAITPELKKFYHTRGSYGYIVAKLDNECKPNNLSFYKRLLSLQERYPSSHRNTFVRGRIFTIFENDKRNNFSIGGNTDFSIIGIPEMKNYSVKNNEELISYDVSYLGTALSKDTFNLGYSGINDGSCFYTSKNFSEFFDCGTEETTLSLNEKNFSLKCGGVIGPKELKQFDRSSEIAKLSNKNYIFVNQNLFKYLNQSTIVFEISNSRQIDYDYTSLDVDGKTKIEPLSFVLDKYIADIVDFLNEYNYSDISFYKSVGNESSSVETNTEGTVKLQKFVLNSLENYRSSKLKILGIVFFVVFLILSALWSYLIFRARKTLFYHKKYKFALIVFDCISIILVLLPPFILKNLKIFGLGGIKTFGIQFGIASFLYLTSILIVTLFCFKKLKERLEID